MLNRFFWPSHAATAQLLTELAQHLIECGLAVTVVATNQRESDSSPSSSFPVPQIRGAWSSTLGLPGIMGRAAEYVTFTAAATIHLLAEVRAGDTLLVKTDPPLSCVLGWLVAKAKGATLVTWCQDLFPEIGAALGLSVAKGPTGWAMRRLRTRAMCHARLNVAICEDMAARLGAQGIPRETIRLIPNWADGKLIRPLPHHDNRLRRTWELDGKFVVGCSGNFGRLHDPEPVLALIRRLAHDEGIMFLLIGGGTGYERLRAGVRRYALPNVQFRPYQPRERLAESHSALDLHLVTLRPACEGLAFPSKLYSALAAGRPVLFIGDPKGNVARVLATTGAGLSVDWRDPAEMASAVEMLRAEAETRGLRARRAFDAHFRKELALSAWAEHLAAVSVLAGSWPSTARDLSGLRPSSPDPPPSAASPFLLDTGDRP
jgi:glycosyltransferase involved in cell wall biosynthesis